MKNISRSDSAFTFIVLIRSGVRNRINERRRLTVLLEDLTERYGCPVLLGMCKRNNVSVMQTAVISDLIEPVIFDEYTTAGHYINVLMKRVETPYAFVIWDDMRVETRLGEQLARWLLERQPLCAAPFSYDDEIALMPTRLAPMISADEQFIAEPTLPTGFEEPTLFPYDYTGIFETQAFFTSAGFDDRMDDGFWQLADFGLSAWERRQPILLCSTVTCRYLQPQALAYSQQSSAEKLFNAKHFSYQVRDNLEVRYSAKARRILRQYQSQTEDDPAFDTHQQLIEAIDLIAQWQVDA